VLEIQLHLNNINREKGFKHEAPTIRILQTFNKEKSNNIRKDRPTNRFQTEQHEGQKSKPSELSIKDAQKVSTVPWESQVK
jgi:hypothetical protein